MNNHNEVPKKHAFHSFPDAFIGVTIVSLHILHITEAVRELSENYPATSGSPEEKTHQNSSAFPSSVSLILIMM